MDSRNRLGFIAWKKQLTNLFRGEKLQDLKSYENWPVLDILERLELQMTRKLESRVS